MKKERTGGDAERREVVKQEDDFIENKRKEIWVKENKESKGDIRRCCFKVSSINRGLRQPLDDHKRS